MDENLKLLPYFNIQSYSKCLKFLRSLDNHITRNLKDGGIETRPVQSNGLWCCAMLPAILLLYTCLYKVSPLYSLIAFLSIGLLFYCLLFIVFLSISCLVLKEQIYGGCIASSLVSALLTYTFLGQDLSFSLIFSLPSVHIFSKLLGISLTKFPKTFTIGEAMIVVEGIVLFGMTAIVNVVYYNLGSQDDNMGLIRVLVYTLLSTVGLIVTALWFMTEEHRNIQMFGYVMGSAAVYTLVVLHLVLGPTCIPTVLCYIFMDKNRVQLMAFWLALVIISVMVLLARTQICVKASTVTRKVFHVLASLVFLSGIVVDIPLMMLAAGVGLGLLVLVEALRKSRIEPISSALQSAFIVYSDEKDVGSFAMTPIYLYVALACPLILVPTHSDGLELLSGVLSIGIGDTAASWFGSRYGINKWTDSNRTYEGTAFNILSQVCTIYALQMFELLKSNNALIRTAIAATISALVEATTDQVDNLILPFTTILAFQATWFLK